MESESAPSSRFRELLQEVAAGVPDAADKIVSEYGFTFCVQFAGE